MNYMEKKSRNPAGMAKYTKNIISTNSMSNHTKNQLLRELLDGISLDDLKILVDLKNELFQNPKIRRNTSILPPLEFRDYYKPKPKKIITSHKPIPIPHTTLHQECKANGSRL